MTDSSQLEVINRLNDKVEGVRGDIHSQLEKYIKKDDVEKHYATKYFCGWIALAFFLALCAAYVFITPLFIDSKNSQLNENIKEILNNTRTNKTK